MCGVSGRVGVDVLRMLCPQVYEWVMNAIPDLLND